MPTSRLVTAFAALLLLIGAACAQPLPGWWGASTPGGPVVTWDPAHTNTSLTLSNANLTITETGAFNAGTVATQGQSVGLRYWEVLSVAQSGAGDSNCVVALGDTTYRATGGAGPGSPGVTTHSLGMYNSGQVYNNSGIVATYDAFVPGNVVRVAWNATSQRLWIAVAGGNWNASAPANPTTGVGGLDISAYLSGTLYPAAGYAAVSAGSSTVNFGHTGFTYTVPAGYVAYGS